ncbi:hypothetical protein Droror1_Dr00012640, partial [Drosera rotundifolia]
ARLDEKNGTMTTIRCRWRGLDRGHCGGGGLKPRMALVLMVWRSGDGDDDGYSVVVLCEKKKEEFGIHKIISCRDRIMVRKTRQSVY